MPILAAALLAMATLLLAACGSDAGDDADSDPQELLERTFSEDSQIESGLLSVTVQAEGEGGQGGTLDASLSGPFQARGEGELPLLDIGLRLLFESGEDSQNIEGALTLTQDAAYVTVDETAYEVDEATYGSVQEAYAQSAAAAEEQEQDEEGSAVLSQLGIDPANWLTDVTNEGVEEVDGTEVVRISGTADVSRILADTQELAQTGGQAAGLSADELGELEESVRSASVDVFTGADDNILRRLDLGLELDSPDDDAALALTVSIALSEVNEDQEFPAPEDPQPLEQLLPGGLGPLGAMPSGPGEGDAGGGFSPPDDAYLQCLQEAGSDQEAINECAGLLQGSQ